jgi:UMF1 family MFS transporter
MAHELNSKKVTHAWTMYDWANSVYSLTIATAVFPPYYDSVSKAASIAQQGTDAAPYMLNFLGFKVVNSALYSYVLSISFLLVALISPLLSGIADACSNKKFFMKLFCYTGSLACISMFFFTKTTVYLGLFLFTVSLIGFAGSIVFYNAFLPEIATEDMFDRLSARGFSLGYIGSVILLLINLTTIMKPEWFFPVEATIKNLVNGGLSVAEATPKVTDYYQQLATRLSFVSVGIWWAGFAQITFKHVPETTLTSNSKNEKIFAKGFKELKKVFTEIRLPSNKVIRTYLIAFFFTSMGVQTVMYVASLFGSYELKLPTADLIVLVIIIQLIATVGAWLFSRISEKKGNIFSLIIMIIIWLFICLMAYFVQNKIQFYILGALVGTVMGGIQSLLRSTYAKLIPDTSTNHASYFSFYDVCEKLAIVFGTLVFGLLLDITGSMRSSVIALGLFFILGLLFISRIKNFKEVHP